MWKNTLAKNKEREAWLDIAKAFGIGLVVLSHTEIQIPLVGFFGGMFMIPVFFVAAGYTYRDKGEDFPTYAKGKAKRLLIPYLVTNLFLVALFILLNREISRPSLLGIFYSRSMLMCADSPWNMALMSSLNSPTWFLTCLFLSLCIYRLADRKFPEAKKRRIAVACAMALGILLRYVSPVLLPWALENALFFLGMIELGRFLKEEGHSWLRKNQWIYANFLIGFVTLAYLNGAVNVSISEYGHSMVLFFFTGAMGSLLCMKAAELTEKYLKLLVRPLSFAGRHTLEILCWHLFAIEVLKKILDMIH